MQRKLTYLFLVLLAFACLDAFSQRRSKHRKNVLPERSVIARYEGGNRNVITLTLFSDSTFFYQEIGSQMGLKATKTGAYLLSDSSISLYTWRSYQFLRNLDEKVRSSVYRCNQKKILMYTPEQETSPDSSFYRSTFTLSRIE
jgi:hypothetical protein